MTKIMEQELKDAIRENFPTLEEREIKKMIGQLKKCKGELVLYKPTFRGIVLRVGVTSLENGQSIWYSTPAEDELNEILDGK